MRYYVVDRCSFIITFMESVCLLKRASFAKIFSNVYTWLMIKCYRKCKVMSFFPYFPCKDVVRHAASLSDFLPARVSLCSHSTCFCDYNFITYYHKSNLPHSSQCWSLLHVFEWNSSTWFCTFWVFSCGFIHSKGILSISLSVGT